MTHFQDATGVQASVIVSGLASILDWHAREEGLFVSQKDLAVPFLKNIRFGSDDATVVGNCEPTMVRRRQMPVWRNRWSARGVRYCCKARNFAAPSGAVLLHYDTSDRKMSSQARWWN